MMLVEDPVHGRNRVDRPGEPGQSPCILIGPVITPQRRRVMKSRMSLAPQQRSWSIFADASIEMMQKYELILLQFFALLSCAGDGNCSWSDRCHSDLLEGRQSGEGSADHGHRWPSVGLHIAEHIVEK